MNYFYSSVFLLDVIVLGICLFYTRRSRKYIVSGLQETILAAMVVCCSHVFIAFTNNVKVAEISYTIFYATINWILLFLFHYAYGYSYGEKNVKGGLKFFFYLIISVALADSVIILLNHFTGWVFSCQTLDWHDGCTYFVTTRNDYFKFHLIFSYFIVVCIIWCLVAKIIKTPPIYWTRYFYILGSLLLVIVWDAWFVVNKTPVDVSVVGYGLGVALLVYLTLAYNLDYLVNKMLFKIEDSRDDMLLFFDFDGYCIYANQRAVDFFELKEKRGQRINVPVFEEWLEDTDFDRKKEKCNFIKSKEIDGKEIHLEFTYNTLYYKNKVEGSFFCVRDCTADVISARTNKRKLAYDELTGVYNNSYLCERIKETLEQDSEGWSLLVTDIKSFKLINDTFGKSVGDVVLKKLAEFVRGAAMPNDLFGRVGTDRFCVLSKSPEAVKNNMSSCHSELSKLVDGKNFPIVVHMGCYDVSDLSIPIPAMFDRAYMALASIKNSYEVFYADYDDSLRQKLLWQNKIIGELDDALRQRQFEMYLQPQADSNMNICGAEALIRWNHPKEGLIPPSWFIKIFEDNGQILKVDMFIWEEACRLLQKWKRNGFGDFYISVNISPQDFYYTDIYTVFISLVKKYDIEPRNLKLEITESAMIGDLDRRLVLIDKLKLAGFQISMDDFGSGYSSLNMLKDINVDVLKIDMFFLYKAKDIDRSRLIIRHVITLAKALGLVVVTEGVETEDQLNFLRQVGSDIFQGYYFAKPLPLVEFESKYLNDVNL